MKDLSDSHIHMADPEFGKGYENIDTDSFFFSCTSRPSEWDVQKSLSEENEKIIPFYGTHPWYAGEHDNITLENILIGCTEAGIGEIGLDFLKNDADVQMIIFQQQLALAEKYSRPVTVHMVKSEKKILDTLGKYELNGIILHSFGSESYVKPFSAMDCYFSVSPRLLEKNGKRISALLDRIPVDRLLVESDYPGCKGSVEELIKEISSTLSIDAEELIKITGRNARKVIS